MRPAILALALAVTGSAVSGGLQAAGGDSSEFEDHPAGWVERTAKGNLVVRQATTRFFVTPDDAARFSPNLGRLVRWSGDVWDEPMLSRANEQPPEPLDFGDGVLRTVRAVEALPPPALSMSVEAPKPRCGIEERLPITVTLRNGGAEPITLQRRKESPAARGDFLLWIAAKAFEKPLQDHGVHLVEGETTLKPGEAIKKEMDLRPHLPGPGRYRVSVQYDDHPAVFARFVEVEVAGREPPDLAAEVARLREENRRLKAEVTDLVYTRMLVSGLSSDSGGGFAIGDWDYWIEYVPTEEFSESTNYRPTGDPGLAYCFRKDVGYLAVNPLKPAKGTYGHVSWPMPSRRPLEALAPSGSPAIVRNERQWPCLAEKADGDNLVPFENLRYCSCWVFSPSGKYAYPLRGSMTGGLPYVDVEGRKAGLVRVTDESDAHWQFTGIPLNEGRQVVLFMNHEERTKAGDFVRHHWLAVRLDPDKPDKPQVTEDAARVSHVFAAKDKMLLCALVDGRAALLSLDDTKIVASAALQPPDRVAWMGFAPVGGDIYIVGDSYGLHIHDGATLRPLASLPVGACSNAYTIGVTFSADGKEAYVATPYGSRFAVVDTVKRELVAQVALRKPAAGVVLWPWLPQKDVWEKRGSCLVIETRLPYER